MSNKTILIGIDLGTTNSSVAVNKDGKIEVVKNIYGDEYTPSVFGFNKSKDKVVGKKAYEYLYKVASEEEIKNYKAEVKRIIGTPDTTYFERAKVKLLPEEISAEILKQLKEDILRKYPEFNTVSAVITTPAAFSTVQAEATRRAGNLAGFEHTVLLQEPIAAAVACGFKEKINEKWLVYDLGGGTFDVALISAKDGLLKVLGHNGDNFLGGKNIDFEIIDKIIIPRICEGYHVTNFSRSNKKYQAAFSKLKYLAENAKIELSQIDKTVIEVGNIGADNVDNEIELFIDLSREDFHKLIKPLIDRTIELTKNTLKEAGINNSNVDKIILVGGPTQIPYVRKRLEKELRIKVDSSADPLTIVAHGACVYGISQKIPKEYLEKVNKKVKKGTQNVTVHYENLTSETEEMVTGVFDSVKDSNEDYYVQIQSESGLYSGSKIKLKKGKFIDTVSIEQNKLNLFWLYLFDAKGNSIPVTPESFSITHGLSVEGAPIPHTIGIVVARNDRQTGFATVDVFEKFFEKGSILPLKKTEDGFKTVRKLKKAEVENQLLIEIREGESEIPDRNTFVSSLSIKGKDLPHDLPEGTPIEITVSVNESRLVTVTAFIPLIDLTLSARPTNEKDEKLDVKQLESDLEEQKAKSKKAKSKCSDEEQRNIENTVESIQESIKNANLDEDEKRKASKQLKDLKIELDRIAKAQELPVLIEEFNEEVASVNKIIEQFANDGDKPKYRDQLSTMKAEGDEAVSKKDKSLLIHVKEEIKHFGGRIYSSSPKFWIQYFQYIATEGLKFTNAKEAEYYIEKGRGALARNDLEELKRCVNNLTQLLSGEEQANIQKSVSGITR